MNPTCTIFYDGLPKDLNDFFYKGNSGLIPGYEKGGKQYWTATDTIKGTNILVSKPIQQENDPGFVVIQRVLENWLKYDIENLLCIEVSEETKRTNLCQDAKNILEDIMRELHLQDRLYVMIDKGLETFKTAAGDSLAEILKNAEKYIPIQEKSI